MALFFGLAPLLVEALSNCGKHDDVKHQKTSSSKKRLHVICHSIRIEWVFTSGDALYVGTSNYLTVTINYPTAQSQYLNYTKMNYKISWYVW